MQSARRTRSRVTRRLRCAPSEPPSVRSTSTAWRGGGRPVGGRDAGGQHHVASFFELVGGAAEPSGEEQLADGLGHRAAAGVARADEEDDQAGHLPERRGVDRPLAFDGPAVALDPHPGRDASQVGGPPVDHHVQPAENPRATGSDRRALSKGLPGPITSGAGVELEHVAEERIGRIAGPRPPAGRDQPLRLGGQPAEEARRSIPAGRPRSSGPGQSRQASRRPTSGIVRHPVGAPRAR